MKITIKKIKIKDKKGKAWLIMDDSFNLAESETVHPETAKKDIERLAAHFKKMRDGADKDRHTLTLEQYRCTDCGRMFYINKDDKTVFDTDFGCPYGCDDAGKKIHILKIKRVDK